MRKPAVPESLWAPRFEQTPPHQPYTASTRLWYLSIFRRLLDSLRCASLVVDDFASLSPQVAPQATPPARQPTSSAKESTSLMIRQMFLLLYTCCYLCGASTPRQMWRISFRCLPYLSSAVPRRCLASARLLVESLQVLYRVPGFCFSRPAIMLRGAGAVHILVAKFIYLCVETK